MNELLEKLHDIEGLDPISWWPLGIGWWVVIAFILFLFLAITVYLYRSYLFSRSWKSDALKQLSSIEDALLENAPSKTAMTISECMRRIAVQRFSRKECAGLVGVAWLKWLQKHDPKRFEWERRGQFLIEAPYAPSTHTYSVEEMRELIQAVRRWVR